MTTEELMFKLWMEAGMWQNNFKIVVSKLMRLFVAVNFNENVRSKLIFLIDELRLNSKRGSFVLPDNLHLTLAFLGECNDKQTDSIKKAMDEVCFESIDLVIDNIGRFKRNDGDLWWAGIQNNDILYELQRNLSNNLIRAGFNIDNKKYKPHITLGRKVISILAPYRTEPFGQSVSKIDLMKSERINGILTYTSIYHVMNR